jgi:hypothetical protein
VLSSRTMTMRKWLWRGWLGLTIVAIISAFVVARAESLDDASAKPIEAASAVAGATSLSLSS